MANCDGRGGLGVWGHGTFVRSLSHILIVTFLARTEAAELLFHRRDSVSVGKDNLPAFDDDTILSVVSGDCDLASDAARYCVRSSIGFSTSICEQLLSQTE